MSKDAYWFRHDSTSGRGLRMRKMQHIHGHWGKGIYWDVIETLREQNEYRYENNEQSLQMLCDLIGCRDVTKFMNWYKDCVRFELFVETEGFFLSDVLCENMRFWETRKLNGSKTKAKRKLKGSKKQANVENTEQNRDNITEQNTQINGAHYKSLVVSDVDWSGERLKFIGDTIWSEGYIRRNKYNEDRFSKRRDEFLGFIEDKEAFKSCKELKDHFVNWNKNDVEKFNQKFSNTIM